MAFPTGYSKEDKKNSVGFTVSLKQRETRAARFILMPGFSAPCPGKKHAIRARIIKSCRPQARFRGLPAAILLHLSRPETGSAPGPPAQVQPQKLSEMEFLNKIELRGIVGQSSLNRVGDSQVCRFSLVTEYSYKDRGNNPVVDVTWFNITAWEGKNMPEQGRHRPGRRAGAHLPLHDGGRRRAQRLGNPGPPRHHPPLRRRSRATPKIPLAPCVRG